MKTLLLNIHLLPRLKNIYSQKLYLPYSELTKSLPNLSLVLAKKSINWILIEQEYDEMIKYATALKLGTADAESILRRFTRHNTKHPTYLALCEGRPKLMESYVDLTINSNDNKKKIDTHTFYKVLNQNQNISLIKFVPKTGKKHQLRIVAKNLGSPIVGDMKYNLNKSKPSSFVE